MVRQPIVGFLIQKSVARQNQLILHYHQIEILSGLLVTKRYRSIELRYFTPNTGSSFTTVVRDQWKLFLHAH